MFTLKQFLTRTIKRNFDLSGDTARPPEGVSVVKKSPEQEQVEKAIKYFDDYSKTRNNDPYVLMGLLKDIHSANEKLAKTNAAKSFQIDADLVTAIMTETDEPTKAFLIRNHARLQGERIAATRKFEESKMVQKTKTGSEVTVTKVDVSKSQLDAMNKRAGLTEAVDAKDNNPRQAQAFVKGLERILARANPNEPQARNYGARVLLQAMKEGVRSEVGEGGTQFTKLDLSAVNMRGLIDFALSGLNKDKYRSNGSYLWGDSNALSIFEPIYKAHEGELRVIFQELQAFYNAGQTSEDWLLAKEKMKTYDKPYDKKEFLSYLSNYREGTFYEFKKVDDKGSLRLESADRSFFTPYAATELESYFSKLDGPALVDRIKDIIKVGGGSVTNEVNSPEELFKYMKLHPTTRAQYIRGLNFVAMTPNRAEYFLTGKLVVGIVADKAVKLIEEIKEKDTLEVMRRGLEKSAENNKKSAGDNLALSAEQRKSILDGIDSFVTKMKTNEELKSIIGDGMLAITNKGAAVGGGATMSLNSMLADSVSAGGSVATDYKGGFGAALSLAATKELYHSVKADFGVHYGIMAEKGGLSPFAGAHGTYEDFIASVTKGPGFVNLFLGMKVGKNTEMIRNLEGLSSAQKEIYELAVKNNIETVSVKNLVTDPAIATRMDGTIKSILRMNGFKPELSNEVRYAMVYSAVVEAMNQEVLMLRRESNDNGWVLKQIGLNFGKVAGLAYVLPGFGIGRDDLRVEIEEGKLQLKKTVALKDVDAKNLLKTSGYDFTESFDTVKQEKKFVIAGKAKAAPTVLVPSALAGQGAGKVFVEYKGDNVTITAGRNVELVADRSVDGKITITVKDKGEFEKTYSDTTATEALNGIDLTKNGGFEKLMQTKEARVALANAFFWGNSELTQFLAAFHKADMSDARTFVDGVTPKLSSLLAKNKNNKAIALIIESLGQNTFNYTERMSKIIRIRTGLMTDVSNTENLSILEGVANFSVKEGVKKNWESRKASKALIALTGALELSKFDGLMNTEAKTYKAISGNVGGIDTDKLIGVVAGYKGGQEAHGFSVIPKGMMTVAQAGGKNLIEEMTTADAVEKVTALGLIALYQPKMWQKMVSGIEKSVKTVTGAPTVSISDINELLSTGKATINGKAVTSTAKFYRLAFGECLNTPSYGIDLGVVTSGRKTESVKDGSSMSGSRVEQTEVTSYTTKTALDGVRLSVFGGHMASPTPEAPNPGTKPGVTPDPSTTTQTGTTRDTIVTPQPGPAPGTPNGGLAGTTGNAALRPGSVAPAPLPGTVTQPAPLPGPVANGPVAPPPPTVVPAATPKVSAGDIAQVGTILRGNGE